MRQRLLLFCCIFYCLILLMAGGYLLLNALYPTSGKTDATMYYMGAGMLWGTVVLTITLMPLLRRL